MRISKKHIKRLWFFIVALFFTSIIIAPSALAAGGYTWTPATGAVTNNGNYCYSLAASSTGRYAACANYGGYILTSSDYGATWVDQPGSGSQYWYDIGMSGNGQYIAASSYSGDLFVSSDYGVTWTDESSLGSQSWGQQSVSASGQYIVANANGTTVYISSDYGAHWTAHTVSGASGIYGQAMSANGQYIVEEDDGGYMYTSNNYGVNWVQVTALGQHNWYEVGMSPSGQYLVSGVSGGYIYTSSDYGATWIQQTSSGQRPWYEALVSSNGQNMIAEDGNNGGSIYESSDGGQTWTSDPTAGAYGWFTLAGSSDLSRVIAGTDSGVIYTGYNPSLYVAPATPPAIVNKTTSLAVNSSIVVDVLSGVSGNPDPSTLSIITPPLHGIAVDPPGTITYTPNHGYVGSDSLAYQVCSSLDNTVCSTATLTFNVTAAAVLVSVRAPDTGFGVYHTNPLDTLLTGSMVSVALIGLGLYLRKNAANEN